MPIGERIAYWRQRRGLTQRVLADLIGRSESWLSQVERGIRSVDRMSVMLDLASVLHVKVTDLTGQPLSLAPNGGVDFDPVADIRHALLPYDVIVSSMRAGGADTKEPPNLDVLRSDTAAAWDLWEASRYVELGGDLPRSDGPGEDGRPDTLRRRAASGLGAARQRLQHHQRHPAQGRRA
jgi:transcriptional regulator with XRE-family HTH domain